MVDFDRSLIGRVFTTATPVVITAEMIAGFCAVMDDTNPRYRNSAKNSTNQPHISTAPPGFAAAFRALEDIFQHLPNDVPRLAAGMDVEFIESIRAGDAITVSSQLVDSYRKTGRSGPMTFFVIRSTLMNQHGAVVVRIDHRFTYRG
jgi:acyl dehydratase